jgi:hypothetical protein
LKIVNGPSSPNIFPIQRKEKKVFGSTKSIVYQSINFSVFKHTHTYTHTHTHIDRKREREREREREKHTLTHLLGSV